MFRQVSSAVFPGGFSRQRIRYQACQFPLVQHAQLMERTGRRHIQKLCMSVIHRIFLSGGIQDEHCVKFQSLRIFHRKDHDSAAEFSLLQIAFHDGDVFFQFSGRRSSLLPAPAYHCNGVKAFRLPVFADLGCIFHQQGGIRYFGHLHRIPMTDNRFHRIAGKTSMMQDIRCKLRYFHCVPVAFFQYAEAVLGIRKKQLLQFFPIIQAVAEMDILGHVPHNGISAFPDAVFQDTVCHHSEILRLVDYHVVRLADYLRFFYPFIDISQGRQVVYIKFLFRDLHLISLRRLLREEIPVYIINGTLPHPGAVSGAVRAGYGLSFAFRIFHAFSKELLFHLIEQTFVQHVDFALDGYRQVLPDVALHRVPGHQLHQIFGIGRFALCLIVYACFSVTQAFHKLSGIEVNGFSRYYLPFQSPAIVRQLAIPL